MKPIKVKEIKQVYPLVDTFELKRNAKYIVAVPVGTTQPQMQHLADFLFEFGIHVIVVPSYLKFYEIIQDTRLPRWVADP